MKKMGSLLMGSLRMILI
ncbi:hypothetical protein Goklo_005099 [Gossypium klotzschianum]|uniref:Uncharacterized protein n=1 Tax=Gossypium klotzschianum TaxID=34286 RepID=A0A7J8TVY9_9ROSI|nr:hypothetical protein [Gossypium klotzschianum]MBA0642330.1 hypothetical protein [Gossypium klotzschianum]MBA0642331.1 hypothetical protein [Gossypium klotzschianum]MBA0642337.1 hypothetical protein [Gossypium klotzschianum]MBA0665200.1 hypothetical protein [Gossypium klotzschianum]